MKPHLLDKPIGATPLEALSLLRGVRPELQDQKLSYAGRLDPLASGLLVVLHGELLHQQELFWGLPKAYHATVALGIMSDSHDLMGFVERGPEVSISDERILEAVQEMVGKRSLPIPAYSSYRLDGKSLFSWARSGVAVTAPVRRMPVHEVVVQQIRVGDISDLADIARTRIALVRGDFRQDELSDRWKMFAATYPHVSVRYIDMILRCGSGVYVRSIAHEIGRRLGVGGILSDLRRTHVGALTIEDPEVIRFSSVR